MGRKPGRTNPKITTREYWPTILERLDAMAQDKIAPSSASKEIAEEFGCSERTIYQTIQRGDVPSYPSTDRARARAWQEGRSRYIRGLHCQKCGQRVFHACDGRCVNCDRARSLEFRQERRDYLKDTQSTGDFFTGVGLFAEDRTLFKPQEEQKPFSRGTKQHAMASAMLNGATLDELAMITGWIPSEVQVVFDSGLRPKGYGVERRDGHYYLHLAGSVDDILVND